MRRHRGLSAQRSSAAACRTGSSRHSDNAKASNSAVKPEPSRAQGTPTCVVLPQPVQATRGTSACSQASNWKKSRRSEEHTSELQSPDHLVCRLLLEKKKKMAM